MDEVANLYWSKSESAELGGADMVLCGEQHPCIAFLDNNRQRGPTFRLFILVDPTGLGNTKMAGLKKWVS